MSVFDEKYWNDRYNQGQTQWDTGSITRPLKEYFDQLQDPNIKILIPGGGNGYEAEYLHDQGFKYVFLLDFSLIPLEDFRNRNPSFPEIHLLKNDFFKLQETYDLLVEQTFFCALHPSQRQAYAQKAYELLKPGGHLVGLLFDDVLNKKFPPFGGNREEYLQYFEPLFKINKFEPCHNSIKPRAGRELWIDVEREGE